MKTIIAGGRDITNYKALVQAIDDSGFTVTEVVSGGARGADRLGERWAEDNDIPLKKFPAEWAKFGSSAGPRRNGRMAEYGEALIALWDGTSRGTGNMIEQARNKGLQVYVHRTF